MTPDIDTKIAEAVFRQVEEDSALNKDNIVAAIRGARLGAAPQQSDPDPFPGVIPAVPPGWIDVAALLKRGADLVGPMPYRPELNDFVTRARAALLRVGYHG